MPWRVEKNGEAGAPYCVVRKDDGGKVQCFKTMRAATRMMQAMYANADPDEIDGMDSIDEVTRLDDGTVARWDAGVISKVERTPQGGIRVDGRLTRTGVFTYHLPDGSVRRELRHPDEVFHADSLATLDDATVTDRHPTAMVAAENWRSHAIGHVRDVRKDDGDFVAARIVVQDGPSVRAIESGQRRELSCGYRCKVKMAPGDYRGEKYDGIQQTIRYNHVAILPKGEARGGTDLQMRLDARGHAIPPVDDEDEETTMKTIRIDGIDYPVDSAAAGQAMEKWQAKQAAELAAQTEAASAATKAKDELQGRLDGLAKELETLKATVAAATDPKAIDAKVAERATLVTAARTILGNEAKLDGLSVRQVHEAAITKADPERKLDGTSDDYVRGLFEALLLVGKQTPHPSLGAVHKDAKDAAGGGSTGTPEQETAKARAAMMERNRNAWKGTAATTETAK